MGNHIEVESIQQSDYWAIFNHSPEAVLLVAKNGVIVECNLAARQLFLAADKNQLLESPIDQYFTPNILDAFQQIQTSEPQQEHLMVRTQAQNLLGSRFPATIYLQLLELSNQELFLLQIRDATIDDQITDAFYRQDAILTAITFAAERFLNGETWSKDILAILQRLGEVTQTQRVMLLQLRTDAQTKQHQLFTLYEWNAAGSTLTQANSAHNTLYSQLETHKWWAAFQRGEPIHGPQEQFSARESTLLSSHGIQSLCLVPIFVEHNWWGIIAFEEFTYQRIWSSVELESLRMVAKLIGQAIQRQLTGHEIQQQHYQILLNEITQAALRGDDFQATLQFLTRHLQKIFQSDACYLTLWHEDKNLAQPIAASGPLATVYQTFRTDPGEATVTQLILETNDVIAIEDFPNSDLFSLHVRRLVPTTRSILGIALGSDPQKLGAAILAYDQPHHFTTQDIDLARQITDQISLIFSKVILFEETRRQLDELQLLQEIAQAANNAETEEELLNQVTEIVSKGIYNANFGFMLLNENTNSLYTHPAYHIKQNLLDQERIPLGSGVVGKVAQSGNTLYVADTCLYEGYLGNCTEFRSELCVPVKLGSQIFGVINVESMQVDAFTKADVRLVETIAGQVGTALHKLRLLQLERQRRQEAETLRRVTASITASLDIDEVLNGILNMLEEVVPYDSASLILFSPEGFRIVAARYAEYGIPKETPTGLIESQHIRRLIDQRHPVIIADTNTEASWVPVPGLEYIGCWMGVPLIVHNQAIGILNLDKEEPNFYTERMAEIAGAYANQAAIAVDNARLYAELESAYLQTVLSLARAMDARDSYTAGHSQRLRDLAILIAEEMGMQPDQVLDIQWAALLHDIGKIGVPDEILRKPGPLSSEEWEVMKQHPVIGAEIIAPVSKLENVVPIVRHHQEKWDGSGYPDGLTGEQIPLSARVMAIVDAYTAITDERVYRPARNHAEALQELRRCIGTQFDPQVMRVFLDKIKQNGH
jgi:putative nucleotidyltransferase with HDIG domain/PAS domain S-box-containing protein